MNSLLMVTGIIFLVALLFGLAHLISDGDVPLQAKHTGESTAESTSIRLPYTPVAKKISILVSGFYVEYEETWFYAPSDFTKVVQNTTLARQASADEVLDRLCGFAARVYTLNGFAVNNETHSITLSMAIYPTAHKIGNKIVVDLGWLFKSLGINLTLLEFDVKGNLLLWRGSVENVPTSIVIELPPWGGDYKPYEEAYGFSETKVWWSLIDASSQARR